MRNGKTLQGTENVKMVRDKTQRMQKWHMIAKKNAKIAHHIARHRECKNNTHIVKHSECKKNTPYCKIQ